MRMQKRPDTEEARRRRDFYDWYAPFYDGFTWLAARLRGASDKTERQKVQFLGGHHFRFVGGAMDTDSLNDSDPRPGNRYVKQFFPSLPESERITSRHARGRHARRRPSD